MLKDKLLKADRYFILLLAAYTILAIIFAYFYRFQWNTDGLGYLSIAQKYADGNFWPAINGFWSPMYSWLLAIFIFFGLSPIISAKIVGIISGIFLIHGSKRLLDCFDLAQSSKKTILAALVPITVYFAVSLITPDLLVAVLVVYYLGFVFNTRYPIKNSGWQCGVLGALAYLAKTYAFLFFVAHFLMMAVILLVREKMPAVRKNIIRNFIFGIAAFAAVSGIWVALISAKYSEVTVGRTGTYNLAAYGPRATGDPLDYLGFLPPADKYSLSAWDDPGLIDIPPAGKAGNAERLNHYLNNTLINGYRSFVVIYSRFSLLALAIFIASLVIIAKRAAKKIFDKDYFYPVLTILIIQAGYLPIHIEERYIWLVPIILLLLAAKLVSEIGILDAKPKLKSAVLILLVFSFTAAPVYKLVSRIDTGKDTYMLYSRLAEFGVNGRIASNKNWSESLNLAFYFGNSQYFGIPAPGIDEKSLEKQLVAHSIDYYLVWGEDKDSPEFLKGKKEIFKGAVEDLKIYSLKDGK